MSFNPDTEQSAIGETANDALVAEATAPLPASIGDIISPMLIATILQESIRSALTTRLGMIWAEQTGNRWPDEMRPFHVSFTPELLAKVIAELARNAAQAVVGIEVAK